jgi:hypothetical protein
VGAVSGGPESKRGLGGSSAILRYGRLPIN